MNDIEKKVKILWNERCCPDGLPETDGEPTEAPSPSNQNIKYDPATRLLWGWDGSSWGILNSGSIDFEQGISFDTFARLGDDAAGTTEPGVLTSDRFINLDTSSVIFVGADDGGVVETTILPSGTIEIDKEGVSSAGATVFSILPLQKTEGNVPFNIVVGGGTNTGSARNNDVFLWGINAGPNGVLNPNQTALYYSMEAHFQPGADAYHEMHLVYKDTGSNYYRPLTMGIKKDALTDWSWRFSGNTFNVHAPGISSGDNDRYIQFVAQDTVQTSMRMTGSASNGGDGVELYVNTTTDQFIIFPYGSMPATATFNVRGFDWSYIKRFDAEYSTVSGNSHCIIKNSASNATSNSARLSLAPHSGFTQNVAPYIEAVNNTDEAHLDFGTYASVGGLSRKMRIANDGKVTIGVSGVAHGYLQSNDGLYFVADADNDGSDGSIHFLNSALERFTILENGHIQIHVAATYADEAAAIVGGLTTGTLYTSADGIVRRKQ